MVLVWSLKDIPTGCRRVSALRNGTSRHDIQLFVLLVGKRRRFKLLRFLLASGNAPPAIAGSLSETSPAKCWQRFVQASRELV